MRTASCSPRATRRTRVAQTQRGLQWLCSGRWEAVGRQGPEFRRFSMKRSKTDTAATRRRIVEIASKAFRSQGIEATGVAEIMAAAGLTHGGFYRHFNSKEELVAEAVAMSLEQLVLQSKQ